MLNGPRGDAVLLLAYLCVFFSGCGALSRGSSGVAPPPPSHNHVAEMVIKRAFGDMDLPEGNGSAVSFTVENGSKAGELIRIITPEVLIGNGYTPVGNGISDLRLTVTLDTLHVTLVTGSGGNIERIAEARLSAVLSEAGGARRLFRGTGQYADTFPSGYPDRGEDIPFVIDRIGENKFFTKIKPAVIGVAMTVFAWALYSYRG